MRYERQVVLEMPPGSNASAAAAASDANSAGTANKKTDAKPINSSALTAQHGAPVKTFPQTAAPGAAAPASAKKKTVPKAKPHATPAKHPTVAAKPPADSTQFHPPQVVHP
jgi:cell division protein FtsQ